MTIPRDPAFDSTLAILRDGYNFIFNRCRALESDLFRTRVMGMKTVCIHGREAAELFYDESKLQRRHALPRRVVTTLFGKNAVQTLDDEAHRVRRAAFLSLMGLESMERLFEITAEHWRQAARRWERQESVVLFDEAQRVLTESVCAWAGVPLLAHEVERRARDFGDLVDSFGGIGPRLWKGKVARVRTQRWIGGLIEDVRKKQVGVRRGSALEVMANHRGLDGRLLPTKTAAVELINVLRPTAAIAWYITFAALALHEHPGAYERLNSEPVSANAGEYADLFMQEVRRYYPFTPFLGAMVRKPFVWKGHRFRKGTLVLLDVHGTNHDPELWMAPQLFRPERFQGWEGDAYTFIPQGGGPRSTGHRCPGEWITMHNIALALHVLTRCMTYEVVPGQDLSFDLSRMPTRPNSGFVIRDVRVNDRLFAAMPRLPSGFAAREGMSTKREPLQAETLTLN